MSHLLKAQLGQTLPSVARAEGSWVWDTAGRRYLDGSSGAVVVSLGHAHPEVVRVLHEQAQLVTYAVRGQSPASPPRASPRARPTGCSSTRPATAATTRP